MASHLPGTCCYQGIQHEGVPTGTIEKVGDFEVYITRPKKEAKYGVLLTNSVTDILGHKFNNAQLIADDFASNGYLTFMPDLFYGDPIPLNKPDKFDMQKWLKGDYNSAHTAHLPSIIDPIIDLCLNEMRTRYGIEVKNEQKIGGVGYCFGAKYVVRHLNPEQGKLDAGYTAHPAFVDQNELEAIKGPLAIAAAEKDTIFSKEKRQQTEYILGKLGHPTQVNLYYGVEHGFAIRGDPRKREIQYAKESAFFLALQWFEEHLKGR
ncbi:hypothetical protein LTS17_000561 [Exophiala oligosperma]